MPVSPSVAESPSYLSQLFALARRSASQLVRPASDARRAEAAMRLHLRRAYADLLTAAPRDNVVAARPADPDV